MKIHKFLTLEPIKGKDGNYYTNTGVRKLEDTVKWIGRQQFYHWEITLRSVNEPIKYVKLVFNHEDNLIRK